uniref:SpaA n=1 Tax=Spirochaeta aurantia TaxID=147 RepID=Q0PI07_SPIAU|nr:SpaA [Spirochaeta aurantia]
MKYRTILAVLILGLTTSLLAQTPTASTTSDASAQNTDQTANSSGTSSSTQSTSLTRVRSGDDGRPSVIEMMYKRFVDQKQFGYDSFFGVAPSVSSRGRVPDDYSLGPGDMVTVQVWGDPVDLGDLTAQFSSTVSGEGTLFYPPVGQVRVDGLLRSDAEKLIAVGLAKKYKRFELRIQVQPQRVFPLTVAGLVGQPGVVIVDSWTSVDEVLTKVGGVKKNGTLRSIRLVKPSGRVETVDLYGLLISGKRPSVHIEEGDVLQVGPIGRTAAVYGEVKVPGIFELADGETAADLLSFAGGILASGRGAPMMRISWDGNVWAQSGGFWTNQSLGGLVAQDGDVLLFQGPLEALSFSDNPGYVQVGGEVAAPGFVPWTARLTIGQALAKVGGTIESASISGLTLVRPSVAKVQRQQIETSLATNQDRIDALKVKIAQTSDAVVIAALNAELATRSEAIMLLTRSLNDGSLGRVFLDRNALDTVELMPGDQVTVPRQSGVVLVFGEVYNPGAQVWTRSLSVRDSIMAVGGVTSRGDWNGVYVIRASGRVESAGSRGVFLGFSTLWGEALQPGDFVYVPAKISDASDAWTLTKDALSVISQTSTTAVNVLAVMSTLGLLK